MATPTQPRTKKAKVIPSSGDDDASTPGILEVKKLSDITDDNILITKIKKLAATEDDPPLLFDWNTRSLEEFWNKAVSYQATIGAVAIPINGGVNLPAVVDVDLLKRELLLYLRNICGGGTPSVLGGTVGLGCSIVQFGNLMACIGRLDIDYPWFQAVLNHLAPLTGGLARVYTPRPRNAVGIIDPTTIGGQMWA